MDVKGYNWQPTTMVARHSHTECHRVWVLVPQKTLYSTETACALVVGLPTVLAPLLTHTPSPPAAIICRDRPLYVPGKVKGTSRMHILSRSIRSSPANRSRCATNTDAKNEHTATPYAETVNKTSYSICGNTTKSRQQKERSESQAEDSGYRGSQEDTWG